MFRRTLIAVAALLATAAVLAQAYRWVDEDGIVHFSDRPHEGAERIDLPTYRAASGPRTPLPSSAFSRRNDPQPDAEEDQTPAYASLAIASPAADETLWNIEGVLNVQLRLQPRLQRSHRVRAYLDGAPQNVSGTSFQLQEVFRGTHTLQAEVTDRDGNLMIRSEPTTFHVQQNSIARPRPN